MMAKPADKMVQSGNSRVKVTLYGQINRAIRFANTGDETEITSVSNDGSATNISLLAVGKANPNLTISALYELRYQHNRRSFTREENTPNARLDIARVDLRLDHKNLGKLSMGRNSMAGDAAGLYELTGVSHVYGFAGANGTDGTRADASVKVLTSGDAAPAAATDPLTYSAGTVSTVSVRGKARGFRPFSFFGYRQNRIRYDTPSLMGARLSLSYGENKTWSAGLSYAGAPPGVKNFSALFAAGYRKNDMASATAPESAWAVSGGIKHSSGFNISGSYDADGDERTGGAKHSQWGVSLGWTGKFNDSGATAIGIGFNRSGDGIHGSANQYWIAINQNIDAAAADVYAGVSFDSGTVTHTVSDAEALASDRDFAAASGQTAAVPILKTAGTPCYTAGTTAGEFSRAAKGDQCEVERDGVMNFVVGVRIKF